ncbi:MAG TPA: NAD(P)-binding domain-containing protein [Streptosporangiaceae bacterium]
MSGAEAVTVLGLGPMGRALAGAFVAGGHRTTVWNRTPGRDGELVAGGAERAGTAAEAVAASALTVVCVVDDAAVRAIGDAAGDALRGRALVNLTSDTPERARETAAWAEARGAAYLDGAIMTPAATIGGPVASLLLSGDAAVHDRHGGVLAALGSGTYLGADPGRAAAHDVALLDMFWSAMGGIVHGFALAGAEGVAAPELAPYARGIGALLPGIIDAVAAQIAAGHYPGDASTIASAAEGMAHIVETAHGHGIEARALESVHTLARTAMDKGHATDGFARLAEVLRGE